MGVMKRLIEEQMYKGMSGGGTTGFNFSPDPIIRSLPNINIDKFNNDVRSWGKKVAAKLRQRVSTDFQNGKSGVRIYKSGIHQFKKEGKLSKSIRAKFRKEPRGEQIDTIGFGLERHGVFLQKGVGRGYISQNGGVARVAKSDEPVRYRIADNWFNGILDDNKKMLSNIITKHAGDKIVLNTKRMFIK